MCSDGLYWTVLDGLVLPATGLAVALCTGSLGTGECAAEVCFLFFLFFLCFVYAVCARELVSRAWMAAEAEVPKLGAVLLSRGLGSCDVAMCCVALANPPITSVILVTCTLGRAPRVLQPSAPARTLRPPSSAMGSSVSSVSHWPGRPRTGPPRRAGQGAGAAQGTIAISDPCQSTIQIMRPSASPSFMPVSADGKAKQASNFWDPRLIR